MLACRPLAVATPIAGGLRSRVARFSSTGFYAACPAAVRSAVATTPPSGGAGGINPECSASGVLTVCWFPALCSLKDFQCLLSHLTPWSFARKPYPNATIIWRYLKFERFVEILETHSLWFSRPFRFEGQWGALPAAVLRPTDPAVR